MTLPVSRVVKVDVQLGATAPPGRDFSTALIIGDSSVIDAADNIRSYASLDDVAKDFGLQAPEYLAASLHFGQVPAPDNLLIGRWFRTASAAVLRGGILTLAEQAIANFAFASCGFTVTINGTSYDVSGINTSTATTLQDIVNSVNTRLTALTAPAAIVWDGTRFSLISSAQGSSQTISFATAPSTGTDLSVALKLTSGLATQVPGQDVETPVSAVQRLYNLSADWYAVSFAAATFPDDIAALAIAAFIESASISRIYGVTITTPSVLDPAQTGDLASQLMSRGYTRSLCQYSANPYAVTSLLARAITVDFTASLSVINLMFKIEPGVAAANLSSAQADALQAKRCNVFVKYQNNSDIIQYGTMSSGYYIDDRIGLDWLQNHIQTTVFALLYTSATKIPQSESGQNQIIGSVISALDDAVSNGLIAPGTWTGGKIGQIDTGSYLTTGYYIYSEPIDNQDPTQRALRVAPTIQAAIKLSGAVNTVDVQVLVNR